MRQRAGFSLLEILLVLAIIGLLLGAGTVALNPARRLANARNQQRELDLRELEAALKQYRLVEGQYPTGIIDTETEICDVDVTDCTGFIDLETALVPEFLQSVPEDPSDENPEVLSTPDGSGYAVTLNANGTLTLRSLAVELGETIQVN